jgi:hypothetical protein
MITEGVLVPCIAHKQFQWHAQKLEKRSNIGTQTLHSLLVHEHR